MKPRLFLTGPSGIGKSTMISRELGECIRRAGGFLTVRDRNEEGRVTGFDIYSADGYGPRDRFLDMTGERPRMDLEVFSGVGLDYLRRAGERPFAVLDEIGGVELLDGGEGTARETKRRLAEAGLLFEGEGDLIVENSSGDPEKIALTHRLLEA